MVLGLARSPLAVRDVIAYQDAFPFCEAYVGEESIEPVTRVAHNVTVAQRIEEVNTVFRESYGRRSPDCQPFKARMGHRPTTKSQFVSGVNNREYVRFARSLVPIIRALFERLSCGK